MRPPLTWALALLLSAPLSQAAESSSATPKTNKSTRSSSGDSDEGDSGKSGTFLGRMFSKSPDAPVADSKKSTASSTAQNSPKGDAKSEGKSAVKKSSTKEKAPDAALPAAQTDDERFILARKAASEDPKVIELRNKADAATKDAEVARLTRAYLRTLYGRMRTLEPKIKERIDLTEAAALRLVPEPAQ